MIHSLCNDWEFVEAWSDGFALGEGSGARVRLPHTVKELPPHYGDHMAYQMLCGYRKTLSWDESWAGKRIFLRFDGAGHIATVYVNGKELSTHNCGYTAFTVEITDALTQGENTVAVKLDTTENGAVPPFGFVIDYLTYGGLYREAWLDVREKCYIDDVFVTTPTLDTAHVALTCVGAENCRVSICEEDGTVCASAEGAGELDISFPNAKPWTLDDPHRYILKCELLDGAHVCDTQKVKFGFRTAKFDKTGFYLNGEKTFLRGLNRHQCYPYMGYAAPESLQREDARILKEELGCTAVRTSHYPQSQYFIDECDRIGLLVFTEIPGWQHIGNEDWKDQAVENTREMVLQYRNHPSIVLWGVRINESGDDNAFYTRTNAVAHEFDPSRPTSGVRCFEKSNLLEDIYAFNDFSHCGNNAGVRPKRNVTTQSEKALLVSEYGGHMFPTKSFDNWERRQEHALRHARVMNDAMADGDHAGCFGWCMFDYPTHKDFGSGDRVCYHGVLDAFRNPKLAAALYASQSDKEPVLVVGSPMDIGDYPGGTLGEVVVFSNADEVALYKNDVFVTNLSTTRWGSLPHGPKIVDDLVGEMLETVEHFPKPKAELVRKCLIAAGKHGINSLPPADIALLSYTMMRYKLRYQDAYDLYGKYIGNWGGAATSWRFDAIKDGKVVKSVTCRPNTDLRLEVTPSTTHLHEAQSYDAAAVRIRVLDGNGNIAPYAQLPIRLTLTGDAELIGSDILTAEGGMAGTYIRTVGKTGNASLTIKAPDLAPVTISFTVE